jgi:hypothetical protein
METKQVDITTLTTEELYKLAFERQKIITQIVIQLGQEQANVAAIETLIASRSKE